MYIRYRVVLLSKKPIRSLFTDILENDWSDDKSAMKRDRERALEFLREAQRIRGRIEKTKSKAKPAEKKMENTWLNSEYKDGECKCRHYRYYLYIIY